MSAYGDQVLAAIQATVVGSGWGFTWFRDREGSLPRSMERGLSPESRRSHLVSEIQGRLYQSFYCTGIAVPRGSGGDGLEPMRADADWLDALTKANFGAGSWQRGWVLKRHGNPAEIERRGLSLLVAQGEYRGVGASGPSPAQVELRMPKELTMASPGFYMALGDRPLDDAPKIVRLYWNTTPRGAIELFKRLTVTLNRAGVAFRLKTLGSPRGFDRRDSAVLYLSRGDLEGLLEPLATIHAEVASHLKSGSPALTKPLASGLGFADDPPDGGSFGMHRCGLIAEAIVKAHEAGVGDAVGRLHVAERVFRSRGLALEAPYLNPGAAEVSDMPRLVRHPSVVRDRAAPFGWTDAASRIADRICSEAIWAGGRCNWVGIGAGDASHDAPDSIHRLASLGPDVYGGTSGIALFLAETYYKTRDHDLRKTALGAMRQAVARADAFSPRATSVGFYGGWTGIAAVAARIARLLGEESLLECARALVRRFASRGRPRESFDLIYGYAGGITPLLALSRMLEDDSARALAEAMGERLVRQASRTAKGCSWTAGAAGRGRHLVGLSHGASGAAYALLELFDEIPNPVYRDTALGAFRFERHWFDPGRGDWRDARWAVGAGGALSPTWCYGAPGIALSRMRGYEATRDEGIRGEAVAALAATRRAVGSALPPAGHDLSLCHGVGGCVDVLLSSCEARSPFAEGANRELAVRGAEGVLRHCLDAVGDWPAAGAPRPVGLMLGLAGMGHLALRAEYPDVPSVLSICKDAWLTSCRARNPRRARHPFAG